MTELSDLNRTGGPPWHRDASRRLALAARTWLEGSRRYVLIALVVLMGVPAVLGTGNLSYVPIAGVLWGVAWVLSRTEADAVERRLLLGLFGVSLVLRLTLLLAVFEAGKRVGGPFLGLDSTTFFDRSTGLATSGFALPAHPIQAFRDFAVAHYYLFATAIRYLGADLFGLQTLNSGLTALVGMLMYAWSRRVVPQIALPVGIIVALYPSLMVLSALDLLKDPSVLFLTTLAVWAAVRLLDAPTAAARGTFAAIACLSMLYLRLDRFYVAAYLEGAVVVGALTVVLRQGVARLRWRAAVWLIAVVVIAEVVPVQLGWPGSPQVMASSFRWAREVSHLREYSSGLVDRLHSSPPPPEWTGDGEADSTISSPVGSAYAVEAGSRRAGPWFWSIGLGVLLGIAVLRRRFLLRHTEETLLAAGVTAGAGLAIAAPTTAANLFRRLYGPFVWILPDSWSTQEILTNDYLLYPGMLVWYVLLPFMVAGLVTVAWRLLVREPVHPVLVAVWFFTAIYWTQYLLFNFSFRHRETLFPFLCLFALIGLQVLGKPLWRRAYGAYWIGLVVIAAGHLTVRSLAHGP